MDLLTGSKTSGLPGDHSSPGEIRAGYDLLLLLSADDCEDEKVSIRTFAAILFDEKSIRQPVQGATSAENCSASRTGWHGIPAIAIGS